MPLRAGFIVYIELTESAILVATTRGSRVAYNLMAHRLSNYLRAYRVRAGFSQEEMAYLLGLSGGPKISKYEMGRRMPDIRTLIAYERVLGVPMSELYAGLHNQVDRETRRRAKTLADRITKDAQRQRRAYTLAGLASIARPAAGESDLLQWDAA